METPGGHLISVLLRTAKVPQTSVSISEHAHWLLDDQNSIGFVSGFQAHDFWPISNIYYAPIKTQPIYVSQHSVLSAFIVLT